MDDALEYSRRLYENVLDWYKRAETKAQVALAIDGAFLAFLTKSMFVAPTDGRTIYDYFTAETWILLALMVAALVGSIGSVLMCVRSQTYSDKELDGLFERLGVNPNRPESYSAEVMWFFQMIGKLQPGKGFVERMRQVGKEFEIEALANQIHTLSQNVKKKHSWVNRAFVLTGASLIFFLAAGVSYLWR